MSMFQVRNGGSIFQVREEEGVKRIVKFIKLNINPSKFSNARFNLIKDKYSHVIGAQPNNPNAISNKMQGKVTIS
jgi:hypothetical protein